MIDISKKKHEKVRKKRGTNEEKDKWIHISFETFWVRYLCFLRSQAVINDTFYLSKSLDICILIYVCICIYSLVMYL